MPKSRQIALNADSGAFVSISATVACTMFEFIEDEAAAMQGLQFKTAEDGFTATRVISVTTEQNNEGVRIPNPHKYGINGPLLGLPAQGTVGAFNYRPADVLLMARSNSATPTTINFVENE
jgi:hypothetical protein